jgi:hypothetical protein
MCTIYFSISGSPEKNFRFHTSLQKQIETVAKLTRTRKYNSSTKTSHIPYRYLLLDEILLGVPVEEPNLEDDVRVGDPLSHVPIPKDCWIRILS